MSTPLVPPKAIALSQRTSHSQPPRRRLKAQSSHHPSNHHHINSQLHVPVPDSTYSANVRLSKSSDKKFISGELQFDLNEGSYQNTKPSLFLALPTEIRLRIYELTFDYAVHVDSIKRPAYEEDSPLPLTHDVCPHSRGQWADPSFRSRGCTAKIYSALNQNCKCANSPPLSFSLLRTCQQVYKESKTMGYACNLFMLHYAVTFKTFITRSLSPSQAGAVRELSIKCILSDTKYDDYWNVVMSQTGSRLVTLMSSLRTLHISIRLQTYQDSMMFGGWKEDCWVYDLLQLQRLPLRKVTVGIDDYGYIGLNGQMYLVQDFEGAEMRQLRSEYNSTQQDVEAYAHSLQRRFLAPWDEGRALRCEDARANYLAVRELYGN